MNYYERLEVSPSSSGEVIAAAYRALAKKYHPDINSSPNAAAVMKEINLAYEVLSDPISRQKYDSELKRTGNWGQWHQSTKSAQKDSSQNSTESTYRQKAEEERRRREAAEARKRREAEKNREEERKRQYYEEASRLACARHLTEADHLHIAVLFDKAGSYSDAVHLAQKHRQWAEEERLRVEEEMYKKAAEEKAQSERQKSFYEEAVEYCKCRNPYDYRQIATLFRAAGDYKDAQELASKYEDLAKSFFEQSGSQTQAESEYYYDKAETLARKHKLSAEDYTEIAQLYTQAGTFKNAAALASEYRMLSSKKRQKKLVMELVAAITVVIAIVAALSYPSIKNTAHTASSAAPSIEQGESESGAIDMSETALLREKSFSAFKEWLTTHGNVSDESGRKSFVTVNNIGAQEIHRTMTFYDDTDSILLSQLIADSAAVTATYAGIVIPHKEDSCFISFAFFSQEFNDPVVEASFFIPASEINNQWKVVFSEYQGDETAREAAGRYTKESCLGLLAEAEAVLEAVSSSESVYSLADLGFNLA